MSAPGKRILIVEDQRLIAADIESTLKKVGYQIAGSVAVGDDAVRKAVEVTPDLILMDIRLRGEMDGIQAAEAIRERLDVPIVYLTAYADEETIRRARGTSPFGYLVKPFNERELRAAIEMAISKHETDRLLFEERSKRRAAEEFKLLVEGVQDYAIFLLDSDGRIASWNEGARRIKGYSAEEILGKHFSIFYPKEAVGSDAPDAVLRAALRDGRTEREGWRVRKDGSLFWAHVTVAAIRDGSGRLHGFGKITRDLTERRRAELEQKRAEERRRFLDRATLALASSLDMSSTLQQAARIVVPDVADWCLIDLADEGSRLVQVAAAHVEPEKEELARRLARTLEPQPGLEHGALHVFLTGKPEVHPQVTDQAWAAELLGTGYPELLRQLGLYSYICVPIHFRGRTVGVLSLLRATKERRYDEGDLAFAEDLAGRLAMAIDNARLYQQAQEAIRARDEFLQIASHELKTPLTPLQLQLDVLSRAIDKSGIQSDRLSEKLSAATRQTVRLSRLVESLLDVSRITSGRIALEPEPLDLAELAGEVVDRFRPEARAAGSELTLHVEQPVLGRWDRLRIEQILSNLLANAIKYGRGKPIEVDIRPTGATVRIAVTDQGIGIEKEALGRIFERFERAVSLRHFGGLGLGLFIARQLAEAHGGSIVAHSQAGHGSTFTVVLPLEATAPSTMHLTSGEAAS